MGIRNDVWYAQQTILGGNVMINLLRMTKEERLKLIQKIYEAKIKYNLSWGNAGLRFGLSRNQGFGLGRTYRDLFPKVEKTPRNPYQGQTLVHVSMY